MSWMSLRMISGFCLLNSPDMIQQKCLFVIISLFPDLMITWKLVIYIILFFNRVIILPNKVIQISSVEAADAGEYICAAENIAGSVVSQGTIIGVNEHPVSSLDARSDILNVTDTDVVGGIGEDVLLECLVRKNSNVEILWTKGKSWHGNAVHYKVVLWDSGATFFSSETMWEKTKQSSSGLYKADWCLKKTQLVKVRVLLTWSSDPNPIFPIHKYFISLFHLRGRSDCEPVFSKQEVTWNGKIKASTEGYKRHVARNRILYRMSLRSARITQINPEILHSLFRSWTDISKKGD